jgi:hypothetical protein
MGTHAHRFGPEAPDGTDVDHGDDERRVDTGEVEIDQRLVPRLATGGPSLHD